MDTELMTSQLGGTGIKKKKGFGTHGQSLPLWGHEKMQLFYTWGEKNGEGSDRVSEPPIQVIKPAVD